VALHDVIKLGIKLRFLVYLKISLAYYHSGGTITLCNLDRLAIRGSIQHSGDVGARLG